LDTASITTNPGAAGEYGVEYPPLRTGVFVCVLLFLAQMVSLMDRMVLSLLVEPIKKDLALTDVQFSLLQGLAFVVLYATAGIFLGYVVDKASRRNLIIACLTVWSSATVASGFSNSFGQLFAARLAVGVGEAGVSPASYSLLCDYFKPKHRGRAFGVAGMGATLGMAISLLAGAAIYRWISEEQASMGAWAQGFEPWQLTFMAAGLPGLVLAVIFLMIREPRRQPASAADIATGSIMEFLTARKQVIGGLLVQYTCYQLISYATFGWTAAYYMRVFGFTVFQAGMATGSVVAIGAAGSLITGFLGDRWIRRRAFGGRLRSTIVACGLAVPGLLLWYLSPTLIGSIAGGILTNIAICINMTAAPLVFADITPHQYRGRMVAIYLFVTLVAGIVLGPLLVASISDYVFRDESKVNFSILAATLPAVAIAVTAALLTMKRYSEAVYSRQEI